MKLLRIFRNQSGRSNAWRWQKKKKKTKERREVQSHTTDEDWEQHQISQQDWKIEYNNAIV